MNRLYENELCSDLFVRTLINLKVKVVFAITGAGNLALIDALVRDGSITIVYSHHEQAAVMEAQGYSRVSGQIGVVIVTTGGGTSNTLTGVLSAFLDSIPLLLISGNESSFHFYNKVNQRSFGVQGFDSCESLKNVTKISKRLTDADLIGVEINRIVKISQEGRKGPVHLDVPMDLQRRKIEKPLQLGTFEIESSDISFNHRNLLMDLVKKIELSSSPILYIGNGCRNNETIGMCRKLIDRLQIPFILSWSALDLFPHSDPLFVGKSGIYGERAANIILQRSDLLIAVGTRLSIPQVGYDKLDFARNAEKWIIEIDESECAKFEGLNWNICKMDAYKALSNLIELTQDIQYEKFEIWKNVIKKIKETLPKRQDALSSQFLDSDYLHSVEAIECINEFKSKDAIIVTDVGAGLLSGHYALEASGGNRIFTSQGLGEMGFGLPAAIGAFFADQQREIFCLNTDGGIMFNLQELQLVREYKIPLKLFVFNNLGYAMIRISQENLFDRRVAGSTLESGISFPSFHDVANTFGMKHYAVKSKEELRKLLDELKNKKSSVLIEVLMNPEQRYLPRLGTTKTKTGELVSPPLEDLEPLLELSLLEDLLGYKGHPNSYKVRNLECK